MDSEPILTTHSLCKSYFGVQVLGPIDLQVHRREILGIIGENGAGKSTLAKCLSGLTLPTRGQITYDGAPRQFPHVSAARRAGIVMIPQEFNLIADLTVWENLFLGQEWRRGGLFLARRAMRRRAAELLAELEADIDPEAPLRNLSVAAMQMVEVAKALATDCRLLIMDEPTTVLNQHEVETLFGRMQQLRDKGTTILYISHKLHEVRAICDRVAVLRDGNLVSIDPTSTLSEQDMARRMVGRDMTQLFPGKPDAATNRKPVLSVRGLSIPGLLADISFDLHEGEILGVAGLMGAGRTELAEALYGIRPAPAGEIAVAGHPTRIRCPQDAVRQGIAYLSEDRQGCGILPAFSIRANTTLISWRRYGRFVINTRREAEAAQRHADAFNIRAPSIETPLQYLSGGNQQRVALAKGLDATPRIFMFDEPTRGIDIKARSDIYAFLHTLADAGLACMLISSDLEEIIGMCRRVGVMRGGRLVGFVANEQVNEHEIMMLATGVR